MPVQHIHGGNVFAAAQELGWPQSKILDFSANINPLGPPPGVFDSISQSMHLIVNYPDPHCMELKQALSEYLDISKKHIVTGNGVAELIYLLVDAFKGRRALIPVPTFTEYGLAVTISGGKIEKIPLAANENFTLNIENIAEQVSPGDLIFICNPNNPTGNLYPRHDLLSLLKIVELKKALLIVDEAFIDFVPEFEASTMIPHVKKSSNLIVLYSLTKFFAIPGLRLGAMLASPGLIERVAQRKNPWNVNLFAQVSGKAALEDKGHMLRTRELVKKESKYLYDQLADLPTFKPFQGRANFILVDIGKSGFTSIELAEIMRQRGILIRDCSSFPGLGFNHIRLAVKKRDQNKRLIEEMTKILKGAR